MKAKMRQLPVVAEIQPETQVDPEGDETAPGVANITSDVAKEPELEPPDGLAAADTGTSEAVVESEVIEAVASVEDEEPPKEPPKEQPKPAVQVARAPVVTAKTIPKRAIEQRPTPVEPEVKVKLRKPVPAPEPKPKVQS